MVMWKGAHSMDFCESLVNVRKEKGISRKDFAEQLQIPYTTLRNYETGQREPGHKLLIKMAAILHVSVDELIGYQPQNKKASLYSSEAMKLAADFDGLDSHGQRILRLIADEEKLRCAEEAQFGSRPMIRAAARSGGVIEIEAIHPDEVSDSETIP